jgi:hypothetical protein
VSSAIAFGASSGQPNPQAGLAWIVPLLTIIGILIYEKRWFV